MMNKYLKNLEKLEFIVTDACTGRCKHCQEGEHKSYGAVIDHILAKDAMIKLSKIYNIKTCMVFGGEPLLYPEAVFSIMEAARDLNIPKRQLITNGYFTCDRERVKYVASKLKACGVNDLLLSVDSFHQESIPLSKVRVFAEEALKAEIPIRLQPAYLVSKDDVNPYNKKTYEILSSLSDLNIQVGEGNVVFPSGNAIKYLSEYFKEEEYKNPYMEDPFDVRCLSFSSDGSVLNGNIKDRDIYDIIKNYKI